MDIIQLYQDFSVDFRTEGHKHCRPGWVNVECPWCEGNAGYHLGYNLMSDHYVCWRCGFHPVPPTIALLLRVREREAYQIINKYGLIISPKKLELVPEHKQFKFPSGLIPLQSNHKRYLEKRGFDPEYLEKYWYLQGSGPISLLDNIDYRHRIIIPFLWGGITVSFDSRDITNKHTSKYMACPKIRELIPHKEILYGKQEEWLDVGICVEGPTDVWRLGKYSFATSGIKYTSKQVRIMAKTFKRIGVCFDGGEPQALQQANSLVADLKFRGVDAFRIDIEGDPGDLSQEEADYLIKQIIK